MITVLGRVCMIFQIVGAINIKVSVWGYVARPGKYIVPDYTTVSDLLSFAGGPNQNAEMDDLENLQNS